MMNDFHAWLGTETEFQHLKAWRSWFTRLSEKEMATALSTLETERFRTVVKQMPDVVLSRVFPRLTPERRYLAWKSMDTHRFVGFYGLLRPKEQAAFFRLLSREEKDRLLALFQMKAPSYEAGTAGSIMSASYLHITPDVSAEQALQQVRLLKPDRRSLSYVYILNPEQIPVAVLTLHDLVMAAPDALVSTLADRPVLTVYDDEPVERALELIEAHDLVVIPVVNRLNRMLGVITHDTAMEVLRDSETEDMLKLVAVDTTEPKEAYFATSAFTHFRRRAVWIVTLAAVGIISGLIIHSYEKVIEKLLILALYMPMVADTGGNAGSQAATVIVRALALGDVNLRDWWRVILKECQVSILLALVLGILAVAKVAFLSWETELPAGFNLLAVAGVIALALTLQVITSTLIGATLPLVVKRLGGDPAVASTPAITTIVDITGLLIYFMLAVNLLSLT